MRIVAWLRSSPAKSSSDTSDQAGWVCSVAASSSMLGSASASWSGARRRRLADFLAQLAGVAQTWHGTLAFVSSCDERAIAADRSQDEHAEIDRASVGIQQALIRADVARNAASTRGSRSALRRCGHASGPSFSSRIVAS